MSACTCEVSAVIRAVARLLHYSYDHAPDCRLAVQIPTEDP